MYKFVFLACSQSCATITTGHFRTLFLFPKETPVSSYFLLPLSPALGSHTSTFSFCKLAYSGHSIPVESYDVWLLWWFVPARWLQGLPMSCHVELHSFLAANDMLLWGYTASCLASHLLVIWVITTWPLQTTLLWHSCAVSVHSFPFS